MAYDGEAAEMCAFLHGMIYQATRMALLGSGALRQPIEVHQATDQATGDYLPYFTITLASGLRYRVHVVPVDNRLVALPTVEATEAAGWVEHECPACGAVTRERMAG